MSDDAGSINDLPCAAEHLATYTDRSSGYAWPAYDEDPNPMTLAPADVLAPAFLSHPIRGTHLNRMFRRTGGDGDSDGPADEYGVLVDALAEVVDDPATATVTFAELTPDHLENPGAPGWGRVLAALDAVQRCTGLTSVAVTKILHRKRPALVPIVDTELRSFYAAGRGYGLLFHELLWEVQAHGHRLDELRYGYETPGGRPMTRLRALDIAVWMHRTTGCERGPRGAD